MQTYETRLARILAEYEALVTRPNLVDERWNNGWYERYRYPVVTNRHIPPHWRYDLNPQSNPFLLERLGVNATMNSGAIEHEGKIKLVVRVEGFDRKSFFAIAESENGIDNFRFTGKPLVIAEDANDPETNTYDMRLVQHADGWIYGVYCVERKDPKAPPGDLSAATAQCAIARTKDLEKWERLPEVKTPSPQQRNVVIHPEFVNGKYALYTRPQDGFISAGKGGGIGWGLCDDLTNPVLESETIIDQRIYHTIKEVKNGMGGPPLKTAKGWLHIDHGVRAGAAGLRYVLYAYLCDLQDPSKVIARPGGYFIAPFEEEFVGDVGNVTFGNGMVQRADGTVLIYYASADTRMHVAKTTVDRLLDYVLNTPEDPLRTALCVKQRNALIDRNLAYIQSSSDPRLQALIR